MKKKKISIKEVGNEADKGRCLQIDGVDYPVYEVKIVDGLINNCYVRF